MGANSPTAGRTPTGIGARLVRKEDDRLLRGFGSFVDDIAMPGVMDVAFVRSPQSHARIRAIHRPPGASVLVRADLAGCASLQCKLGLPGFKVSDQPPLADGKVRFVGEPVAVCFAESRALAEDLAGKVQVELDDLGAVMDAVKARLGGGPLLHEAWGDNVFLHTEFDTGIDAVALSAPVQVRQEYCLGRQVMNPMEGKAMLAHWDHRANQLVVYLSTQIPHLVRSAIAEQLGIGEAHVRVISPDVGGGFGYKCVLHPEELTVAWLALKYRVPFRWIEDRREHLMGGANCREHHYALTAYADERGRLLGLDAEITIDAGAYSVWPFTAGLEGTMAARGLLGPYDCKAYRARSYTVATNKPAIVPYRGVARPGMCFAIELTMDAVARAVGREPSAVRRENLVPASAMPFKTSTGGVYDSGDYAKSLDMAADRIDVPAFRMRQAEVESEPGSTRRIGVGFATYLEMTAHGTRMFAAGGYPFVPGHELANVRFTPDGALEIRVGVHSHGQGMETTIAQIASEVTGLDPRFITVLLGDTGQTPYSTGTYASRSITMAGGAVARACRALLPKLTGIAAHLLQTRPEDVSLVDGRLAGPSGDLSVSDAARAWYRTPERLPADAPSGGLEVTEGFKPTVDSGQYSYGTHAAIVEVDLETCAVSIIDYVVVEDCGTMVNPMVVEGQTLGGTAQGIGSALYEEMVYDAAGQPLAVSLADYIMPGASEMPRIQISHIETPSPNTEYGIKGVGEGGAIPPAAAIINAVNDALRSTGVVITATPMTPSRLFSALLNRTG